MLTSVKPVVEIASYFMQHHVLSSICFNNHVKYEGEKCIFKYTKADFPVGCVFLAYCRVLDIFDNTSPLLLNAFTLTNSHQTLVQLSIMALRLRKSIFFST